MNHNSSAAHRSVQLQGRTRLLARLAWAVIVLTVIISLLAAFPYRFEDLRQDPYGFTPVLAQWGFGIDAFVAYGLVWELLVISASLVMAGVIFWRKSDEWVGLLISVSLVLMVAVLPVIPALGLNIPSLQVPILLLRLLAFFSIVLVCFLFPTGRFVPRWVGVWFVLYVIVCTYLAFNLNGSIVAAPIDIQSAKDGIALLWMLLGMSSGVLAQFYRFRRVSSPVQRQQTKWVMVGFAALFLGLIVIVLPVILFPDILRSAAVSLAYLLIAIPITLLGYFAVPFSFGISILRYRLWDIDLIVRRTLMYAALTATLAVVYFGSIILMQQVFLRLSGERSPAAIVISTLAIAALSSPLRRRIQMDLDRRFFRSKYDAEKAMANFNAVARDEVELEALTAKLISVVEDTMQPEHISLWLKDPGQDPIHGSD
jgi:hypothetical protein